MAFHCHSFISFHDISPEGKYLWSSSSITDCIGFTPEELIGVGAYDMLHPDDIPLTRATHTENVMNDMVATQLVLRYKTKDGGWLPCMVIFSLCYDFIVGCSMLLDPSEGTYRQVRAHSAAMTQMVASKQEEFARIRRHHEAFNAQSWNPNGLDPEPRACFLLNRFSRNLGIMYASPSCEFLFQVQPDEIVGKPLLVFIRADDLGSFVEQVDVAKSTNAITHMRFWFQSPNVRQEIPCEVMFLGSADGMVAILRRCKPFVRKRLIAQPAPPPPPPNQAHHHRFQRGWSRESSVSSSQGGGGGGPGRAASISTVSDFSMPRTPNTNETFSPMNTGYQFDDESQDGDAPSPMISDMSSPLSTPIDSPMMHPQDLPPSQHQHHQHQHHHHHHDYQHHPSQPQPAQPHPLSRSIPMGSIHSILNRNRAKDQSRPLMAVPVESGILSADGKTLEEEVDGIILTPGVYGVLAHRAEDSDEEDDDMEEVEGY